MRKEVYILEHLDLQKTISCMDTIISLRIYGERAKYVFKKVKAELFKLEKKLSRFMRDSDISRINHSAGKDYADISVETCDILSDAIRLGVITEGLFDITVAPLADLWNYKNSFRVPLEDDIRSALSYVNYHDILLNSKNKTAALRRMGQAIDLGGIGKGYAGDRCIKILAEYGITSAFISIGGNVSTLGNNPNGSRWCVSIQHPRDNNSLIGSVKVTDKAVVTSGDYERYFIDDYGNRRHHILSPVTGYPADSGLISATVIYDNAVIADALSTAVFIGGIEKGLSYMSCFPEAEAILVDKNLKIHITNGLKESFKASVDIEASDIIVL